MSKQRGEVDYLFLSGIGLIFLVGAFFVSMGNEAKKWEAFKAEHKCKVTAKVSGDTFNTVGLDSKGGLTVGIGSTPDKTGWTCDDGITYYR